MKLLTFTLGKRRAGSLTRKQRILGVAGLEGRLAKFLLAGVTCSHYDFRERILRAYRWQFPFLILRYATRDTHGQYALYIPHVTRKTRKQMQAISVLSILLRAFFLPFLSSNFQNFLTPFQKERKLLIYLFFFITYFKYNTFKLQKTMFPSIFNFFCSLRSLCINFLKKKLSEL